MTTAVFANGRHKVITLDGETTPETVGQCTLRRATRSDPRAAHRRHERIAGKRRSLPAARLYPYFRRDGRFPLRFARSPESDFIGLTVPGHAGQLPVSSCETSLSPSVRYEKQPREKKHDVDSGGDWLSSPALVERQTNRRSKKIEVRSVPIQRLERHPKGGLTENPRKPWRRTSTSMR